MGLANQHLSQLNPDVRDAVLGSAGMIVAFRDGGADAAFFAREFAPEFVAEDRQPAPVSRLYPIAH